MRFLEELKFLYIFILMDIFFNQLKRILGHWEGQEGERKLGLEGRIGAKESVLLPRGDKGTHTRDGLPRVRRLKGRGTDDRQLSWGEPGPDAPTSTPLHRMERAHLGSAKHHSFLKLMLSLCVLLVL